MRHRVKRAGAETLLAELTLVIAFASAVAWSDWASGRGTPPRVDAVSSAMPNDSAGLSRPGSLRHRTRIASAVLADADSGSYLDDLLRGHDSTLTRWPNRTEVPLAVWIQPRSDVPNWSASLVAAVTDAFAVWENTGIPVRFLFVDDALAADVSVRWIDRFDEPISGTTAWSRDDRWWITDARVTLAVHQRHGLALDAEAMRALALHEIGHVLGLDHASDSTYIMSPRVRVRGLTSADRATVRRLYQLPPGRASWP